MPVCMQLASIKYLRRGNQWGKIRLQTKRKQQVMRLCPSESTDTKDFVSNLENQSAGCKLVANTKEALSSTEHSSWSCVEIVNTRDHTSVDSQHIAGMISMKEQSSTDDIITTDTTVEGLSVPNGDTKNFIVDEGPSLTVEASGNVDCADKQALVLYNRDNEIVAVSNDAKHFENGHTDCSQDALNQNAHGNQIERHLKKTRTCLLLLAILAVSLTYQSGLNPPGCFCSSNTNNHSAGVAFLRTTCPHHAHFIAFFYLNAIAFVASLVMILMLLNKSMIKKVTKRCKLQIAMIVDLLCLTGSFVMGSCREAKKSIDISVLACLVLAYVAVHVLIAIHVIPPECKKQLSAKLKRFWSALPCYKQTVNIASDNDKELDRRRSLLLTLAILAATVTYQARINLPGGVWSDDQGVSGTAGNPILQDSHRKRYDVFYYSNSVSFVSSVVITILLVNKESLEHGIKSYALRVCLVVGLLGLLIAYAAGSCRNRKETIFLIIIAVSVLISLVIQVLLSSMHGTLGSPLAQFIESLQRWGFCSGMVPREVTFKSLETSDCEGKKERKRHKYLMLIAILAASVTYQAGLNPPGGFWSDDKGHVASNPVLHDINHQRYKTFFCFNAIVVIMLLLSKSVRKKDAQLEVLLLIMILDLLALMTAFAAGSTWKFSTSVYVFVLVAGVVIYLVIVIVLSRSIEKYLIKWKRSGLFCSRHPECVSKTITPVQGEQV